jgi:hypothetical protein
MYLVTKVASVVLLTSAFVLVHANGLRAQSNFGTGQVSANFNRITGELTIVGSSRGDSIRIRSGYPNVSIEGKNKTKVNGQSLVFFNTTRSRGIQSIKCYMGAGNDVVEFKDLQSVKDVFVDGDAGRETITLKDSRILGDFAAIDVGYYIGVRDSMIAGNLSIELDNKDKYSANNHTTYAHLTDSTADVTTIVGSATKSRNDIILSEFNTGTAKITTGRLNDEIEIYNVLIVDLSVSTGGGADQIWLGSREAGGVTIIDNTNIDLAGGDDIVRLDTSGITYSDGFLQVNGGTGFDQVLDLMDIYTWQPSGNILVDVEWEDISD